eukprot:6304916-Ditylum_brightwellii.AAC.1
MYVGIGGGDSLGDIMLRNPELTRKKDHIASFEIWISQRRVVDYIDETLKSKTNMSIFEKPPTYP